MVAAKYEPVLLLTCVTASVHCKLLRITGRVLVPHHKKVTVDAWQRSYFYHNFALAGLLWLAS